ncbi:hypothetical protein QCN29_27590 [Streptomyces sp. HNM0663]|uniref:Integral membrane protein n=1 Tax=Streptomyces chengmaiensis TaxID=3040919 RepID=A0ABT6HUS6_9ACTN|nr:hypothetical protein [Streptomyces chengmaiensis]MDH2392473.1 hypothetical protein [Streptomyces chengmaiensis]
MSERQDRPATRRPRIAPRRGPADPVKALLHRHRELCERAVDPLEIAAGLEVHGVTDRTAARFRHRDVFSLAEELYARVPRGAETASAARGSGRGPAAPGFDPPARDAEGCPRDAEACAGRPGARPRGAPSLGRVGYAALTLTPGAVCALAVAGWQTAEGSARIVAAAAGTAAVAAALLLCLRSGPLSVPGRRTGAATRLCTLWLLAYAAYGHRLPDELIGGGPAGPWAPTPQPLVGLALAVAPAAWCARLFAVRVRRRLAASRGLDDFSTAARPLLFSTTALYLLCLAALLAVARLAFPYEHLGPAVALGALLFLARLLAVHGSAGPSRTGLAAACGLELAVPTLLLAARLPGCGFLAAPVESAVAAWGSAALPQLACGAAALALLAHAAVALSRASAHTAVPSG